MDLKIYPQPGDKFELPDSTILVESVSPGLVCYSESPWNSNALIHERKPLGEFLAMIRRLS